MFAYADETGEALAGELRPGIGGVNNVCYQTQVGDARSQIPAERVQEIEIVLRVDSAGAGAGDELLECAAKGRTILGRLSAQRDRPLRDPPDPRRAGLGLLVRPGRRGASATGRSARSLSSSRSPPRLTGSR